VYSRRTSARGEARHRSLPAPHEIPKEGACRDMRSKDRRDGGRSPRVTSVNRGGEVFQQQSNFHTRMREGEVGGGGEKGVNN